MYQIWVYNKNHYELRFSSKSFFATLLAFIKFDKSWNEFKLIKKRIKI